MDVASGVDAGDLGPISGVHGDAAALVGFEIRGAEALPGIEPVAVELPVSGTIAGFRCVASPTS